VVSVAASSHPAIFDRAFCQLFESAAHRLAAAAWLCAARSALDVCRNRWLTSVVFLRTAFASAPSVPTSCHLSVPLHAHLIYLGCITCRLMRLIYLSLHLFRFVHVLTSFLLHFLHELLSPNLHPQCCYPCRKRSQSSLIVLSNFTFI